MPNIPADQEFFDKLYQGKISQADLFARVQKAEVPMKVLVTGGAGFVGSHLVDRLMLAGNHVTVIDNMSTGSPDNVGQWTGHPNFILHEHDVRLPFNRILGTNPDFDRVYHLACPASPKHYQADERGTLKTCFFGTLNALTVALESDARMFMASTSEIYGDPLEHPQKESYRGNVPTIGPRACYDEGKRVAETLCGTYFTSVDVRIGRIFNTYGPRMSKEDGRVVSEFILGALSGQEMCVFGDGMQTRSFQYVDDLVNGIVALMEHDPSETEYPLLVNLGNPVERTVNDLAEIVKSLIGSSAVVKRLAAQKDDPQRRRPDISAAKALLGWEPRVPIEEGLRRTIDYFRAIQN
jgi:UDP-glucuronate decarboxylase